MNYNSQVFNNRMFISYDFVLITKKSGVLIFRILMRLIKWLVSR